MPRSILLVPKIRRHSYDLAVVAVRRDHTSGVSVSKVYRPWEAHKRNIIQKITSATNAPQ